MTNDASGGESLVIVNCVVRWFSEGSGGCAQYSTLASQQSAASHPIAGGLGVLEPLREQAARLVAAALEQ
jgi:hypothetical protein